MLRRPKRSKNEVVAPKEEEEAFCWYIMFTYWYLVFLCCLSSGYHSFIFYVKISLYI
jgi:hypothetical protein